MGNVYSYVHWPVMVTEKVKCDCGDPECTIDITYDENYYDLTTKEFMKLEEMVWSRDDHVVTDEEKSRMLKFCFNDWVMGEYVRPECITSCDPKVVDRWNGDRCWNCGRFHPRDKKTVKSGTGPSINDMMRVLMVKSMDIDDKHRHLQMLHRLETDETEKFDKDRE